MTKKPESKNPYLTGEQAADRLVIKPSTLVNWRYHKTGPVYRTHGNRVVYHIDDLDAWSDSQMHQTDPKPRGRKKPQSSEGEGK